MRHEEDHLHRPPEDRAAVTEMVVMFRKIIACIVKLRQLDRGYLRVCLLRVLHDILLKIWFRWNAIRHPMRPERGVTLVGRFGARDSLGKVARDLALRLKEAGIPYQTFDLSDCLSEDNKGLLTPRRTFRSLRYDHVMDIFGSPFPRLRRVKKASVLFWEFESGFPEAHPLQMDSDAIAMSDFNLAYFKKIFKAPRTVSKILYPFRFDIGPLPSRCEIRSRFGIPQDDFVVFFNFDFGSSVGRKNPYAVMRAFSLALRRHGGRGGSLVFKTMHDTPDRVAALKNKAEELGVSKSFVHIREYLSTSDLYGLTAASDVYVSLHRGEGFGLGIAEAMSLGVPVVLTAYSAPLEFCNDRNSVLVPYRMIQPEDEDRTHICYHDVAEWADPDVEAAANALDRLWTDRAFRSQLGESARRDIVSCFSIESFRRSMLSFLEM